MEAKRYQLVLMGPEKERRKVAIETKIVELFAAIGLDFDRDGQVLLGTNPTPDWTGFPVAVWLGATEAAEAGDEETMREFLRRGFSLFPVVDDLGNYSQKVPAELRAINGQIWNVARLAADVMRGFRLSKQLRQAFISYRRSESAGVAHQLFHQLSERSYRVFLDTASVESGVDFQKALWSRMADVDLVILLDSPGALHSTWVHQELNRAHDLGLGVVQLIWPGHQQTKGTELSLPVTLVVADFSSGKIDRFGVLTEAKLNNVVNLIEGERIRSLSARRTRLVEGLLDHIGSGNETVNIDPMRNIEVMKNNVKIAEVIPFVGVPDSISIYQHEQIKSHDPTIMVYNGLGVDDEWAQHLQWLNAKSGLAVHQIDDFGNFLKDVV